MDSTISGSKNPWLTKPAHSSFVPLPPPYTHSLHASIAGPLRKSWKTPLLVFITGGGAPCSLYVRLFRELSREWRVLMYDRAGYAASGMPWEESDDEDNSARRKEVWKVVMGVEQQDGVVPETKQKEKKMITATDTAKELKALLETTGLRGPYVVIAHSYGGIIARTFVELLNSPTPPSHSPSPSLADLHEDLSFDDCSRALPAPAPATLAHVIGLSLLDPASELLFAVFKPKVPPPCFDALLHDLDIDSILHYREGYGLTDEEWDTAMRDIDLSTRGADREDNRPSARTLAEMAQFDTLPMDPWPVAIWRANWYPEWQRLFDAGVRAGNGTAAERAEGSEFLWCLKNYMSIVMRGAGGVALTGEDDVDGGLRKRRDSYCADYGHDVPLRRPDLARLEVGWVMDVLGERGFE